MDTPSTERFPKTSRLLKGNEFVPVLRRASVNITHGPLRLRARMNRMPGARLGLVVGKKGNRTAVRRNRIKRIIREDFRRAHGDLPAADFVFQVFAPIEDATLRFQVRSMLEKAVLAIRQDTDEQVERSGTVN